MAIKFANNATTTLASGIVSTDTSITVAGSAGGLFPSAGSGDYFYATINNSANDIEIVKVTARSGDVMTVLRGQDGTVALNWIVGDKFELRLTSRALADAASGVNITELDGVDIGQSDPGNGAFVDLEAQSLNVSGVATGSTPSPGDSSTKFATTAFVAQNSGVPTGCILMWSGSILSIPSGWYLCNGTNGTPDLRNRFLVGAGSTYAVGATGGSADSVVVSHTHTGTTNNNGNHRHGLNGNTGGTVRQLGAQSARIAAFSDNPAGQSFVTQYAGTDIMEEDGNHNHSFTTDSSGSSATNANLPPYYALAYIMKG